eukprot:5420277-Prymnesium_polylepis.1
MRAQLVLPLLHHCKGDGAAFLRLTTIESPDSTAAAAEPAQAAWARGVVSAAARGPGAATTGFTWARPRHVGRGA